MNNYKILSQLQTLNDLISVHVKVKKCYLFSPAKGIVRKSVAGSVGTWERCSANITVHQFYEQKNILELHERYTNHYNLLNAF